MNKTWESILKDRKTSRKLVTALSHEDRGKIIENIKKGIALTKKCIDKSSVQSILQHGNEIKR